MDDAASSECLGLRLGSAFRRVDRIFNRAYAHLQISHAHAQILQCLLHEGEMRIRDVSRFTGLEASTVSRLAKELGRRRLIRRRQDPHDARARLLSPGARAKALKTELNLLQRDVNARLVRDLPREDFEGLLRAAEALDRLP